MSAPTGPLARLVTRMLAEWGWAPSRHPVNDFERATADQAMEHPSLPAEAVEFLDFLPRS